MTILYPTPAKSSRRFAAGLLASRPTYRADYLASDAAWHAADLARREAEDRYLDRLAAEAEAEAMSRYEAGHPWS